MLSTSDGSGYTDASAHASNSERNPVSVRVSLQESHVTIQELFQTDADMPNCVYKKHICQRDA